MKGKELLGYLILIAALMAGLIGIQVRISTDNTATIYTLRTEITQVKERQAAQSKQVEDMRGWLNTYVADVIEKEFGRRAYQEELLPDITGYCEGGCHE